MTRCPYYRLTHSPKSPRYNGSHPVTHYACHGSAECAYRDGGLEGCSVKGERPLEAPVEVATP